MSTLNEEQVLDIVNVMEAVLQKHGIIKEDKSVLGEFIEEEKQIKEEAEPSLEEKVIHAKPSDIKYLDLVDLFGMFTRDLELCANDPTFDYMERRMDFLEEESAELRKAIKNKDRVGVAHESADVAFVAITQLYMSFIQSGFSHVHAVVKTRSALLEIGKANNMKYTPIEPMAKIRKPVTWERPNIAQLFLTPEQMLEARKTAEENKPTTEEEKEVIKAHVEGKADG